MSARILAKTLKKNNNIIQSPVGTARVAPLDDAPRCCNEINIRTIDPVKRIKRTAIGYP